MSSRQVHISTPSHARVIAGIAVTLNSTVKSRSRTDFLPILIDSPLCGQDKAAQTAAEAARGPGSAIVGVAGVGQLALVRGVSGSPVNGVDPISWSNSGNSLQEQRARAITAQCRIVHGKPVMQDAAAAKSKMRSYPSLARVQRRKYAFTVRTSGVNKQFQQLPPPAARQDVFPPGLPVLARFKSYDVVERLGPVWRLKREV